MARVLFIEEEEALRRQVRGLLKADRLSMDEERTGQGGISRALAAPPDLVLMDVRLPDLQGSEVVARLRREPALARVPIVALGSSPDERGVALAAGAVGFLYRSVDPAFPAECGGSWTASQRIWSRMRNSLPSGRWWRSWPLGWRPPADRSRSRCTNPGGPGQELLHAQPDP